MPNFSEILQAVRQERAATAREEQPTVLPQAEQPTPLRVVTWDINDFLAAVIAAIPAALYIVGCGIILNWQFPPI